MHREDERILEEQRRKRIRERQRQQKEEKTAADHDADRCICLFFSAIRRRYCLYKENSRKDETGCDSGNNGG